LLNQDSSAMLKYKSALLFTRTGIAARMLAAVCRLFTCFRRLIRRGYEQRLYYAGFRVRLQGGEIVDCRLLILDC